MGAIKFKNDILHELKQSGWSTYRLGAKGERIFGERTIQNLRSGKPVTLEVIARICSLLGCQPGDILEYVEDEQ